MTGESNKYLAKKDVYTIDQIASEMNKCEKVTVSVLDQDSFYIWEEFLNKHFKDLPSGFTKFYCFEFSGGSVAMKRLCSEVEDEEIVVKEIVRDPNARKTILRELFDLPPSASLEDIVNATLLLPQLPSKELKPTKLVSLAKKYSCIPSEFVSFYPGGESFLQKSTESIPGDEDEEILTENLVRKKPKLGRPKVVTKAPAGTQSILRFLCAPKIPVIKSGEMMSKSNKVTAFGSKKLDLGSSDPLNNNYLSGGNSLLLSNQGREVQDQEEGKERDEEEEEVVDITDDPPMDAEESPAQKKGTGKVRLSQRGKTW